MYYFLADKVDHFTPAEEEQGVVLGENAAGVIVPGVENPDVGLIPTAEGIAYTLDDFFNSFDDGPDYVPYLKYLVENNNKFPVLVNQYAYNDFKEAKRKNGKLTTEYIMEYIRTH